MKALDVKPFKISVKSNLFLFAVKMATTKDGGRFSQMPFACITGSSV